MRAVFYVDCEVAGAHDLNGVEVAALAFSHVEDEAGVVVGVEADERRVLVAFHVVDGESDSGVLHELVEDVLHEEGLAATRFSDDDEVFRVHVVLTELVEDRVAGVHVAGDVGAVCADTALVVAGEAGDDLVGEHVLSDASERLAAVVHAERGERGGEVGEVLDDAVDGDAVACTKMLDLFE